MAAPVAAPVPLAHSLVSAAVVVAALYYGRDLLMPLALSALLGFVLDPAVSWLKRRGLPRAVAVFGAVGLALALLAGCGLLVYSQVRQLANNLPTYEANITQKLRDAGRAMRQPGMLNQYSRVFNRFEREIDKVQAPATAPVAKAAQATPVQVVAQSESPVKRLTYWLDTVATPLAMAGIVFVFVVLILLDKGDLRDRLLRLLGSDLHRNTDALSDAAKRVSKYLSMQLLVNAIYGLPLGIGLLLIGIPGALMWGMLAAVLRFVPYVGPMIASVFPLALAFAVDPGWSMVLWTLGLIVTLELISNNVIKPWLYGHSTGMSTLSLILAAMFWTALWGPIGLVLSTPITVVLLVLGHHLPQLRFLEILLGSERALDEPTRLHQRLLAGDVEEAVELAEELTEETSVQEFYATVGLGTLRMATSAHGTVATAEHRHRVLSGMETVLAELRDDHRPPDNQSVRVASIGGRWAVDVLAAEMAAHALQLQGVGARVYRVGTMSTEFFDQLELGGIEIVCLHYFSPDPSTLAKYFVRRLRRRWPAARVLVATWNLAPGSSPEWSAEDLGADAIVTTLDELLGQVHGGLNHASELPYAPAEIPEGDAERVQALQVSGMLDPSLRGPLDAVAKRVADAFDCPIAQVVLVDTAHELVHGDATAVGRAEAGEPEIRADRSASIGAHVVALNDVLVVADVLRDPRFATHPGLREEHIRFIAAAPLRTAEGHVLGALCVMDTEPRTLTPRDRLLLSSMADELMRTEPAAARNLIHRVRPPDGAAPQPA